MISSHFIRLNYTLINLLEVREAYMGGKNNEHIICFEYIGTDKVTYIGYGSTETRRNADFERLAKALLGEPEPSESADPGIKTLDPMWRRG